MDPVTGDMMFGKNLDNFARNAQACAQNVTTKLRFFMGEWFLDQTYGTPWFQDIFKKPVNQPLSEADIKAVIYSETGVNQILSFSFELDHASRQATIRVDLDTIYGTIEGIVVTI
jgi:hypothetical protein